MNKLDLTKLLELSFGRPRVKLRDLNIFFRQLAVLIGAGVPLIESLIATESQVVNEGFKRIIQQIEADIGSGQTFSQALAKWPQIFTELVVAMVEAGERSGSLENVLNKITVYYEKEIQFQQKLQAALRYPLLVVIALSIAFIVVITFVIPQFSKIYGSLKADLPWPTRLLIGLNYLVRSYWWLGCAAIASAFYGIKTYISTVKGREQWDQLWLRSPVFGVLIAKASLSRFFRMLATMIGSGIPIVASLETTARTADNVIISQSIIRLRDRVLAGSGLAGPMGEEKIFPATAVQMVAVGEKAGTLDTMLVKTADYFDEETDYMISNLMSLLEPFIILFLGIMVLTLALGIFLPMWNLMGVYTHGI